MARYSSQPVISSRLVELFMFRDPSMIRRLLISVLMGLLIGGCSAPKSSLQLAEETSSDQPYQSYPSANYSKAALANVELGLGYLAEGQVARAKYKLTHAIQLAPQLTEPHSAMAYFLEKVGDNTEAENEHKKAIRLSKSKVKVAYGAVYNNYGAFLCRLGRYREAEAAFQRALQDKQYACTADVYENAGLCAIQEANLLRAEQYFSKAIQQDPKRTRAVLELATIKWQQHKNNDAKTLLTQYHTNTEPNARSTWLLLQISQALHDKTAVAKQALLLEQKFQDSPEYLEYQAFSKSGRGKGKS